MNEIYIFAYYFMLNLAAIHGIILGVGVLNTLYFCREINFYIFSDKLSIKKIKVEINKC
jgi:hypothetical protein